MHSSPKKRIMTANPRLFQICNALKCSSIEGSEMQSVAMKCLLQCNTNKNTYKHHQKQTLNNTKTKTFIIKIEKRTLYKIKISPN